MGEVHIDGPEAIDVHLGLELWHLVQPGFLGSPVIALSPELDSFAHQLDCNAIVLAPLFVDTRGGKAGELKLFLKKLELRLWDVDLRH